MVIIAMIILYFIIILGISIVAYRDTHNHRDYIIGGRSLNGFVTALGVGASDMSGWLMLGLPGAFYLLGYNQIWMPLGLIIGAFVNWQLVAKRLRIYTAIAKDSLTLPAFLANRFEHKTLLIRAITAFIILVAFIFYCAAGFIGGAKLFSLLFELSYLEALLISAPIIIIYTVIGGFLAVNWVDVFQGSLMLGALLLVPIAVMIGIGGWTETTIQFDQLSTQFTSFNGDLSLLAILSLMAWGLGYFGQPHILVRFMAIKGAESLPLARNVSMGWMILSLCGAVAVGLLGRAYFTYHGLTLSDPELILLELARQLFNPWVIGILLAAVLSSIMSTIAAQLMVSASALQEDFYHVFVRPKASTQELLWVGRLTVAIVALCAILLSLNPHSSVLELVGHAWAVFGATFGPVILLALFWPRMNAEGALTGMLAGGTAVVLVGFILDLDIFRDVYELLPGFVFGTLGVVIGSYAFGQPPSEKMRGDFNLMLQELKTHTKN